MHRLGEYGDLIDIELDIRFWLRDRHVPKADVAASIVAPLWWIFLFLFEVCALPYYFISFILGIIQEEIRKREFCPSCGAPEKKVLSQDDMRCSIEYSCTQCKNQWRTVYDYM